MYINRMAMNTALMILILFVSACGNDDGDDSVSKSDPTTTITESSGLEWTSGTLTDLQVLSDDLVLGANADSTYTFNNCNTVGRLGPNQTNCDTAYTGTTLESAVNITAGGVQTWTTPATGAYRFRVHGAGHNSDNMWIKGAIVSASFMLDQGTMLQFLVGQEGRSPRGGNGGSFVTYADNTPLIIAGGAGGTRGSEDVNTRGSTSTSGMDACGAAGGSNGAGGEALGGGSCSGAGAGLLGDGQGCGGALAFVNGATGGNGSYPGGFGGGGGVDPASSPGGGGGYSGGAVNYGGRCTGGGGSFIAVGATNVATSNGLYDGLATFNNTDIQLLDSWHIGHGLIEVNTDQYMASGMRTSGVLDISSGSPDLALITSQITWAANTPVGTSVLMETRISVDNGTTWGTWDTATNGESIPGLMADMAIDQAQLQTRVTLSTMDSNVTPSVSEIKVSITY